MLFRGRSNIGNRSQSCSWVGSTRGLDWVGLGWVEIFQFSVGCVGLDYTDCDRNTVFLWKSY